MKSNEARLCGIPSLTASMLCVSCINAHITFFFCCLRTTSGQSRVSTTRPGKGRDSDSEDHPTHPVVSNLISRNTCHSHPHTHRQLHLPQQRIDLPAYLLSHLLVLSHMYPSSHLPILPLTHPRPTPSPRPTYIHILPLSDFTSSRLRPVSAFKRRFICRPGMLK